MHVIEVKNDELIEGITDQVKDLGVENGAIVSLIGAVDSFTISTMPADDASKDVITEYDIPAEMSGTGEVKNGKVHIHSVMAVEGDKAISGHLHKASVGTWFARAYVVEASK